MVFSFSDWVSALLKGVGHKYIKRIPYNTPKGRRYRYIYRVTNTHQGRHAFDEEHLVMGAKFALNTEDGAEFHGHITAMDGDKITYTIDDGPNKGEEVTTTRAELVAKLHDLHDVSDKLSAARDKVRERIAEAKRAGHEGVVRRLESRLAALGGEPEAEDRADNFETMPEEPRGLRESRASLKRKEEILRDSKAAGTSADRIKDIEESISTIRDNVTDLEESHLSEVFADRLKKRAASAKGKQLLNALAEAHREAYKEGGDEKRARAERALVDFYKDTSIERPSSKERLADRRFQDVRNINDNWRGSDELALHDELKEQETEARQVYYRHASGDTQYTQAQVDTAVKTMTTKGAQAAALKFAYTEGMERAARELEAQAQQSADNFETMPEVEAQKQAPEPEPEAEDRAFKDLSTEDRAQISTVVSELDKTGGKILNVEKQGDGYVVTIDPFSALDERPTRFSFGRSRGGDIRTSGLQESSRGHAADAETNAHVKTFGKRLKDIIKNDERFESFYMIKRPKKKRVRDGQTWFPVDKDEENYFVFEFETAAQAGQSADNFETMPEETQAPSAEYKETRAQILRERSSDFDRKKLKELEERLKTQTGPDSARASEEHINSLLTLARTQEVKRLVGDVVAEYQGTTPRTQLDAITEYMTEKAPARAPLPEDQSLESLTYELAKVRERATADLNRASRGALLPPTIAELEAQMDAAYDAIPSAPSDARLKAQEEYYRREALVMATRHVYSAAINEAIQNRTGQQIQQLEQIIFEKRQERAEERAKTKEAQQEQEQRRQERREQREQRAPRAAGNLGPSFVNNEDLITHDEARKSYIEALVPNAQGIREEAGELRGQSAAAIIAAAKTPLVAGETITYTLPDGIRVGAKLDESSRFLEYQIQFKDGKVSELERVSFSDPLSPTKLKTLPRALLGSVYGGTADDGAAQYNTIEDEDDLPFYAQRLARVKKLEDREREFDTFSKLTAEPRVQKDELDAITPRQDALTSASDIDKKTAAVLKRVIDPKQTIRNLDEAFRVGDSLVATDGHRIFVRRGMAYGRDGEQVSTGPKSIGGIRVSLAGVISKTITPAEQEQEHVGTMSKETAAHVVAALKVGGARIKTVEPGVVAGRALIRADGQNVTIMINGRDVATFPQSNDGVQGDYAIGARYLSDALSGGGAVSLHLPPVKFANGDRRLYSPLRFDSMLGSMHVQPTRM